MKINIKILLILMILHDLGFAGNNSLSQENREQLLQERESALREQMARHEKVITDLKTQIAQEKKVSAEKVEAYRVEWSKKLAEKEKELKTKTEELNTIKKSQATNLLGIYEKMEPKQAAKVFETMDLTVSMQILTQMKAQRAAEIIGKMSPERARQITESSIKGRTPASVGSSEKNSHQVNEAKENNPIAPIGMTDKK